MGNVFQNFLAIPTMVSACEHFYAEAQELFGDFRGDAKAGGGILAVGDHQINLAVLHKVGEALLNDVASGRADDVADEKGAHG